MQVGNLNLFTFPLAHELNLTYNSMDTLLRCYEIIVTKVTEHILRFSFQIIKIS